MSFHLARRSPRLQGYDYSQEGAYFVTICTHHREHRFGEVINGEMHLNPFGNIAEEEWFQTGKLRTEVELDAFVVMPNHVLWQGSFHDHIIRDEHELNNIRHYVINNPALWTADRYYDA